MATIGPRRKARLLGVSLALTLLATLASPAQAGPWGRTAVGRWTGWGPASRGVPSARYYRPNAGRYVAPRTYYAPTPRYYAPSRPAYTYPTRPVYQAPRNNFIPPMI